MAAMVAMMAGWSAHKTAVKMAVLSVVRTAVMVERRVEMKAPTMAAWTAGN